jgi:Flp pilus assembly pilin Flp
MVEFWSDQKGTAGVEYALFLSLISMAIIGVLQVLGLDLQQVFTLINGKLQTVQLIHEIGKNP